MSVRRNRNCKPAPAPAPASIATDRLAAVLHAGLCVGSNDSDSTTVESEKQKLAKASRHAARSATQIRNNDVDRAIEELNAAQKIAEEIKHMRAAREGRHAAPRAPAEPLDDPSPGDANLQTGGWAYVWKRAEAGRLADTASALFKDGSVDEAIEYLQRAQRAAEEMKQLKTEKRPLSSHELVYSSDDD